MKFTTPSRSTFIYYLSIGITMLSLITVAALVGLTIFVRWKLNQNFTFLGGWELEALTIGTFALTASLAYIYRPHSTHS